MQVDWEGSLHASICVGGVREELEFWIWLLQIEMRYLTGGSDVGYIFGAGAADVKRLREIRPTISHDPSFRLAVLAGGCDHRLCGGAGTTADG